MYLEEDTVVSLDYLYKKFNGICFVCKKKIKRENASREHIVPRSLGGLTIEENLAVSHKKCNNRRGNGFLSIYSKHHDTREKHFTILEDHGLLLQIVPDPHGGVYIILGKKKER